MITRSRAVARQPIIAPPPQVHGRVFVRVERCKGCQFCVEFCPQKVLAMSKEINSKGFHYPVVSRPEVCINCGLCASICPDYAILSFPAPSTPAPSPQMSGGNGVGARAASRPGGNGPGSHSSGAARSK